MLYFDAIIFLFCLRMLTILFSFSFPLSTFMLIFVVKNNIYMERSESVFDNNTVEFVTVAARYCALMEGLAGMDKDEMVDTVVRILPLLYLKATLLPYCERMDFTDPAQVVDEDEYEFVRRGVHNLLGADDDYLEVFSPDMAYSEGALGAEISEDLADIYQDVKNFVGAFATGVNMTMNDALVICREHFELYWGQRLVNTMRALHQVKYGAPEI